MVNEQAASYLIKRAFGGGWGQTAAMIGLPYAIDAVSGLFGSKQPQEQPQLEQPAPTFQPQQRQVRQRPQRIMQQRPQRIGRGGALRGFRKGFGAPQQRIRGLAGGPIQPGDLTDLSGMFSPGFANQARRVGVMNQLRRSEAQNLHRLLNQQ